jgi:hypothetical protein
MPANRNRGLKLFTCLGAVWFIALTVPVSYGQDAPAAKPQAAPAPVIDILEIQPFALKTGYQYDWLQSRPFVSDGLLVVLQVDPGLVVPRNAAERVLYAGDRTVQRLNQGDRSGTVIAIIPGDIDLASEPIWFGRPELPERVTADVIKEERSLADSAGIKPFGADKVKSALRDAIEAEDLAALLRGPAADLVLKYSPGEKDLAETWRLPATGSTLPR